MKKNIAVVGCGYWGKNLVRNFYEINALYGICDVNEERLKSFKEKFTDLVVYKDYKKLLERQVSLERIYIKEILANIVLDRDVVNLISQYHF